MRIALANLRFPLSPSESVDMATSAIRAAAERGAEILCFPECFIPGYRSAGRQMLPPDPEFLHRAWDAVARTAEEAGTAVILATERMEAGSLRATARIIDADGSFSGFQDKVQIDPSEEGTYTPGSERRVFRSGELTFGVVICHEGWRYPETVRWAARRGAQVVFHPQFHEAGPGSYRPVDFADPRNSFHEKAAMCRAAENTCWFATVNYASAGSPTTSAVIRPDGSVLAFHPYGEEGLLVVDIALEEATLQLAERYRPLS